MEKIEEIIETSHDFKSILDSLRKVSEAAADYLAGFYKDLTLRRDIDDARSILDVPPLDNTSESRGRAARRRAETAPKK